MVFSIKSIWEISTSFIYPVVGYKYILENSCNNFGMLNFDQMDD